MNPMLRVSTLIAVLALGACGGGDDNSPSPSPAPSVTPAPPPSPSDAERAAAATTTANTNALCAASVLGPYYWELGDADGAKVSGTVGSSPPTANTVMNIASASKWVFAAYVVQKRGVQDSDVPFLNFTSGYSLFGLPLCDSSGTVGSCLASGNDGQDPNAIGKFSYDSGHMQHHAVHTMNLGPMHDDELAAEITAQVGTGFGFGYSQPQLAGGMTAHASGYAGFLRRMLRGELAIAGALGTHKVCTNPATCATALASPVPQSESWNYSLGHWVEDDPTVGDHAFSSAGAFGFYPWIDSSKTLYGVLARESVPEQNAGYNSARCGRLIRKAWLTATPQ